MKNIDTIPQTSDTSKMYKRDWNNAEKDFWGKENLAKEIEIIQSQFINAEDKEKYFYCTKEQFRMFVDRCTDVFINMITERFDGIRFVPSMLDTKGGKK